MKSQEFFLSREKYVLHLRDTQKMSFAEIGCNIGFTRTTASRVYKCAKKKAVLKKVGTNRTNA